MTWIHCSMVDESCVGLTTDENFDVDGCSQAMQDHYFHANIDESIEVLRPLIKPVLDENGYIVHKFKGWVDQESLSIEPARADAKPIVGSITAEDINVR